MSFSPVLPASGTLGWSYLKQSGAAQQVAFARSPDIKRDADYFKANIGKIDTARQLVADRRLLRISLEAFGLEGDLESRAFVQKVLEEGTLKAGAFALRLTDPRYKALAETFGFGNFAVPGTKLSDFPDKLIAQWQERRFEAAVGDRNPDFRLALNARRELAALSSGNMAENTRWLKIIGNVPLRTVMQKALNIPPGLASLDLDRQLATFKTKANALLGSDSVSQFQSGDKVDEVIRRFLIRSDQTAQGPQSAALGILGQIKTMMRRV